MLGLQNTKIKDFQNFQIKTNILSFPLVKLQIKRFKSHVATLAFGLRPRQGLVKVRAKSEAQESHSCS
jgi:hypothetical protein